MSDLQTPRPMDERRKTYLRLIAEICIAIVSVSAMAAPISNMERTSSMLMIFFMVSSSKFVRFRA